MAFVIPAPPTPTLDVVGTDAKFPVRRIYCVGRNYAEHAREMGHDPTREAPFFFQKPADALLVNGGDFPYPPKSSDVHFEIELVVALGKGGKDIAAANALDHVFGYAVGIDMTRRDLQGEAKKLGRPWEVGKAFEHLRAVLGRGAGEQDRPPGQGRHLADGQWGATPARRPRAAHLEHSGGPGASVELLYAGPGDLLFTGTPAGVGAVKPGDRLKGGVDGVGEIEVRVV